MKTLESFLKEFAAFKIDDIDGKGAGEDETLGGDDIQLSIPSQDEDELEVTDDGELEMCKCCGQPIRDHDEEGKKVDKNIDIIDPEQEGGKAEFDIDAVDGDEEDGDPMKDYNLF